MNDDVERRTLSRVSCLLYLQKCAMESEDSRNCSSSDNSSDKSARDLYLLIVKEHSHTYLSRTTVMQGRVRTLQMILATDNTSDYKIQTGERSISICNV